MDKMKKYFDKLLGERAEKIRQEAEKKLAAVEKMRQAIMAEGFVDDQILEIINPMKPSMVFGIFPSKDLSALILLVGKQGDKEFTNDFFPLVNTGGINWKDNHGEWVVQWDKIESSSVEGLKALATYLEEKGFKPQPNGMILNEFGNGSFIYKIS